MSEQPEPQRRKWLKLAIPSAALLVLLTWLYYTPPGLLGKADAIGYAVCHRISTRSFFLDERQLPLCARCSGMHLGALLGMLYQLRMGKSGAMPPRKIAILLAIFLLAFAIDGTNSYLHLFPNAPSLYEPNNILRLTTGTLLGIGIAAVLYPVFNQTVWAEYSPLPALSKYRQMLELLGIAALIDLAVISQNPLLLYPLSLLSAANVLLVLGLIYTIIWVLILKRENRYNTIRELWFLLTAGLATAVLQIAIMDVGRFLLTGSWESFLS
ncbi:MAG: DUF2085 domain-containing protein [Anaerolineae bacterium]|nr:DUF2085 domain-containing protein [Anaerolineae bacterium]